MTEYRVGQVYERDGKRREIARIRVWGKGGGYTMPAFVAPTSSSYELDWKRPGASPLKKCWCATWMAWASKATLVKEGKSDE